MAAAAAADRLILVGDPRQLTQPSRAAHPGDAANSALDHLLGCPQDQPAVIPPERGVFLDTSFRMHPDMCTVVSRLSYDGQLEAVEDCRHLDLRDAGDLSGTGVRFVAIAHHSNASSSPEEAAAVRDLVAQLIGATFVDHRRRRHTSPQRVPATAPRGAALRGVPLRIPRIESGAKGLAASADRTTRGGPIRDTDALGPTDVIGFVLQRRHPALTLPPLRSINSSQS